MSVLVPVLPTTGCSRCLARQLPNVLGQFGRVRLPFMSHSRLVRCMSSLELTGRLPDVFLHGVGGSYCCSVRYISDSAFPIQRAFNSAVASWILLLRVEQGGVVALDERCHLLCTVLPYSFFAEAPPIVVVTTNHSCPTLALVTNTNVPNLGCRPLLHQDHQVFSDQKKNLPNRRYILSRSTDFQVIHL